MNEGGSTDKFVPILVRRVARNVEQGIANFDQGMEICENSGVNTVRFCHLTNVQDFERSRTDALQVELNACRSQTRDLRQNQVALQRRMWEIEKQLDESKVESTTN